MALVLCTGVDQALLKTRRYILERAGHTVVTASDEKVLISVCNTHCFDVAVIGQSADHYSKQQITSLVKEHCPGVKVLELYQSHMGRILGDADSWLETPIDVPMELVDLVNKLANNDGNENSKGKKEAW